MRRQKKKSRLTTVLVVFFVIELFACVSMVMGLTDSFRYGMEYDCSPTEIKKVTLINREDLEDEFSLFDGEHLYEVRVSYENIGDYSDESWGRIEFVDEETGTYCSIARRELADDNLRYMLMEQAGIPAGEIGSHKWFLAVPEGSESLTMTEDDGKLSGQPKTVTLQVPENVGEKTSVVLE